MSATLETSGPGRPSLWSGEVETLVGARPVLVTGASGTVGSAVVRRLLAAGARVRALTRRPWTLDHAALEVVPGDLRDRAALARAVAGCGAVVHSAAELSMDAAACLAVNVDGVDHLLEAMRAEPGPAPRLVHISSVSAYDWRTGRTEFDEDAPLWPEMVDAYGFTKAEGERRVRAAAASHGLPSIILRPVIVLSMAPTSYWGPLAVERARASEGPIVPFREVPYVDADNLAEAVLLALPHASSACPAYNAVDGQGDSGAYLEAVARVLGREAPALPAEAPTIRFPGERIRRELGYRPEDRWSQFLRELARLQLPGLLLALGTALLLAIGCGDQPPTGSPDAAAVCPQRLNCGFCPHGSYHPVDEVGCITDCSCIPGSAPCDRLPHCTADCPQGQVNEVDCNGCVETCVCVNGPF
jgi:nucleoside-diphosphate-sugar epimerase